MISVRTNLSAINAQRMLKNTYDDYYSSAEKLASGFRINRAADDAAGLAISEKMRSQIRGLTQASSNAQNGISFCQTADGALEQVTNMLQRMSELGVQAQDGAMSADAQANIQAEIDSLIEEIDRIAGASEFNGKKILNGDLASNGINFMVGYTSDAVNKINLKIGNMSATSLKINSIDITQADDLKKIQDAISTVTSQRSTIGAVQNRLKYTVKNLDTMVENTTASEARIRDVDTAAEEVRKANLNILYNAGISILAQANQNQQSILGLLQ